MVFVANLIFLGIGVLIVVAFIAVLSGISRDDSIDDLVDRWIDEKPPK